MRTLMPTATKLVQRIREEFEEAPGLQITADEGGRFWALDAKTCELVLAQLHETGFLLKTQDGRYRQTSSAFARAPTDALLERKLEDAERVDG